MEKADCPWVAVATLAGVGTWTRMPGTVATAVAGIPAAWLLALVPWPWSLVLVVVVAAVSCPICDRAARSLGRGDPGEIVLDELVGYLVTMVGLPVSWLSLGGGFLFFRLFDIWKPWPVGTADRRLHGGFGIVMDDVAAGIYAHGVTWLVLRFVR